MLRIMSNAGCQQEYKSVETLLTFKSAFVNIDSNEVPGGEPWGITILSRSAGAVRLCRTDFIGVGYSYQAGYKMKIPAK